MFDSVFGAEMPLAVKFFLAFLFVLCLILGAAWILRRFGTGRLGGANMRGRQPRLAVIDYASVDGRRRLILVRRDNVEHLLMIGGPTDVVVEPNIVRAVAAPRDVAAARPTAGIEALPRAIPLPDNGNGSWPLQPEAASPPRPASRAESAPEEPSSWPLQPHSETPAPRPARDTLSALADELTTRPATPRNRTTTLGRPQPAEPRVEIKPEARIEAKPEPRIPAPPPAAPQPAAAETTTTADESLADMAHRLEAALRKPNAPAEPRSPAMPSRPMAEPSASAEAVVPPVRPPRPLEPKPARADAKPNQSKTLYDSLEQEMASLLGRPTKT